MTISEKIAALRQAMIEQQIDAYILPSTDPHQSEYPAPRWESRQYFSGFTGSAGTLVVTLQEARLWTDSRYFVQARQQLAGTGISLMKDRLPTTPDIPTWLGDTLLTGQRVGVDGRVISTRAAERMARQLTRSGLQLTSEEDLVRQVWKDRPAVPAGPIFPHAADFSGEDWQRRLLRLTEWMAAKQLDYYVLSALDEVAWLLHLRGSDIDYNPLCVAYFVAGRRGDHALFTEPRPGLEQWTETVPDGHELACYRYGDLSSYLRRIQVLDVRVGLDAATLSIHHFGYLAEARRQEEASPVPGWKAIKSAVAQQQLRQTLRHDAVALLRLRRWLDTAIPRGVTEYEVGQQLIQYRQAQPHYHSESFPAIVGYGANGAIVHYRATATGSATLAPEGVLLLDSGGQYLSGTTDITRTFALGPTTPEIREAFTRVLQGHIQLATAVFPAGTCGAQLDVLARSPLWANYQDYGHGTGHGVGFFLNVHEGPMGISQHPRSKSAQYPLTAGMVLSNEPGFYQEGAFGIRTENLVIVQPGEREGWLQFETATLFPLDRSLIVQPLLTRDQVKWIDAYHARVLTEVGPLLEGAEYEWLKEQCRKLT